jgi:hypothetical protein
MLKRFPGFNLIDFEHQNKCISMENRGMTGVVLGHPSGLETTHFE